MGKPQKKYPVMSRRVFGFRGYGIDDGELAHFWKVNVLSFFFSFYRFFFSRSSSYLLPKCRDRGVAGIFRVINPGWQFILCVLPRKGGHAQRGGEEVSERGLASRSRDLFELRGTPWGLLGIPGLGD